VETLTDSILGAFDVWASKAWQPLCVVSLKAAPDAGGFAHQLRDQAFLGMVQAHTGSGYIRALQAMLDRVVNSDAWIASCAARWLACREPAIIRTLSVGVEMISSHRTVTRWARSVGLKRRQDLESVFVTHALPHPKLVLERMRLARVVHMAETTRPRPSRAELATQFGYSSGDYLGKRARAITGQSLGQLVRLGAVTVFANPVSAPPQKTAKPKSP